MNAYTAQHEMEFDTSALRSTASRRRVARDGRLASLVRWIVEFPRRRALIEELHALSDHELADIGLDRSQVSRVFDRDFAARRASV